MALDLKPLRIGHITLDVPVVLAALAGYTDLPYRLICRRLGAPYCASEMMLDRLLMLPGRLKRRFVQLTDEDHPVAGQIAGNEPEVMAESAALVCEAGFDVVDLNFACPVRKVIARKRGGWVHREPELAARIMRAVAARVDRPFTVKLRIAYDGPGVDDCFWRIAEAALEAGAAAICVHARAVQQRYRGRADWAALAQIKQRFPDRTIIGSGDVANAAAAINMIQQTGVDGASFARGAIGNPWAFRQLRDALAGRPLYKPPVAEQRAVLEGHFRHAVEIYGENRGSRMMRKFGIKYARMHPRPGKLRVAFVAVKNQRQWLAVLEQWYADESGLPLATAAEPEIADNFDDFEE